MSEQRIPPAAPSRRPAEPAIRAALPADVDSLVALENESFATDRLSRRSLKRLLASPSAVILVAKCGVAVAGYAILLLRRRSRSARLYSVAVAASFAGRGLGAKLVAAAEEAARNAGFRAMTLEVRADNSRAEALYRRLGYAPVERLADYYADGAEGRRYRRDLGEPGRLRAA